MRHYPTEEGEGEEGAKREKPVCVTAKLKSPSAAAAAAVVVVVTNIVNSGRRNGPSSLFPPSLPQLHRPPEARPPVRRPPSLATLPCILPLPRLQRLSTRISPPTDWEMGMKGNLEKFADKWEEGG